MGKTQFIKDESNATLTIERSFPAPPDRIWRALTDPAILDRWCAPAPWQTRTVTMDFRTGGFWHYAMQGLNGEQHFGRMDYLEIEPESSFTSSDVFCDADGKANASLPRQEMSTTLFAEGGQTRIVSVVRYASLKDMNTILEMGMQEGLTMAQDQLEALLESGTI